eukprot:TRINITY_DN50285_c0_g1_i1.p2 TRINITY_DN50285_c0_g1~~TRINITY_DN50285_c0_g1_i1.p2  ORF type:complete len:329 (+),score=87.88 TRINITY_DN50285_c0_g1_i1:108-989(+)
MAEVKATRKESAKKSGFAGLAAGVVGTVSGHPFDTLKVKVQTGGAKTAFEGLRAVVRQEGVHGLWRGVATPVTLRGPVKSCVYSAYGGVNQLWQSMAPAETLSGGKQNLHLALWQHSISGACAGATAAMLQTPAELVKIRIQTAPGQLPFAGRIVGALKGVAEVGPKGMYRGLLPSMMREVPGYAFYFPFFMGMKEHFQLQGKPIGLFVLGGTTGSLAWALGYPADVIKSRMQAHGKAAGQLTVRGVAAELFRERGVRGLYRGLGAALLRAWVTHAFTMMTYELLLDSLGERS